MKVVKRYKLPVISTRDTKYSVINIINTTERYMQRLLKRTNPKSSHHKEKNFFPFILYLYEMMDAH